MDDFIRDIRYAARSLARNPAFSIVAIVTLALGIGANTAIFSIVHAVVLSPLPFKDAEQLVQLYENVPAPESNNGKAMRTGVFAGDLIDVAARQSGPLALERAGITHADVNLCTIYDSYTITVLVTLEALGFCKPGEGGAFCADGRIGLGGALPVNPDGGGLSSNHPGMRGMFLLVEATRQLRGEAGPAQVQGARLALVHGTGGMLGQRHSGVTLVLERA